MRVSKQARRDAKELFQACRVDGLLDEAKVRQAVALMVEKRPRGYLGVLQFFGRLVKLDLERRTAQVDSAAPLAADLQQAVQGSLSRTYGAGLTTQFSVRPELVGGMRVRVGSDVYDGTIQGRLAALEESF